jgi:hypothetical protein
VPTTLADEADAYRFLERLRWPGGVPADCPHCAARDGAWLLTPVDGVGRTTSTGARSARRIWRCRGCRRQFSVLNATFLQGTRTDLLTWLAVVTDRAAGTADAIIADRSGLTPATVRHLLARLAVAERAAGLAPPAARSVAGERCPGAVEAQPVAGRVSLTVADDVAERVRALLALPGGKARAVRHGTPARRRPLRQVGPSAEYGDGPD